METSKNNYDVLIIGGGVVGTALLYTLTRYTNIKKVGLIEKNKDFALVNSVSTKNSQTLHFGDIETNYSFEKAKSVKFQADMVMRYLETEKAAGRGHRLFSKYNKMVLAVGKKQSGELRERYKSFSTLFPKLRLIEKDEISKLEPRVVEGRDPEQEIVAMATEDGYTVSFGDLSHSFVDNALKINPLLDIHLSTRLYKIEKMSEGYRVTTNNGIYISKVVAVTAGAHSLMIAKSLGYGKNLSILSMAGSFYTSSNVLNGKVYTIQIPKLPFAAIHGDPEVFNPAVTRFGPTAKPIFFLERYNRSTFSEYWITFGFGLNPIISLLKIVFDRVLLLYIFMNFLYDIPVIGKRLFLLEIRKIVPLIKLSEVKYARGIGGTRPQIVNNTKRKLEMGEAKLSGENIIFNITPSPGASTCLGNAYNDAEAIAGFLGNRFSFDKKAFEKDLA